MRRKMCFLLALLFLASVFAGCTDKEPEPDPSAAPTSAVRTDPPREGEIYAGMPGKTVSAVYGLTLAVKEDGTILADDSDGWRDLSRFGQWNNVVSVSTNGKFAVGLKNDGTVESLYFENDPSLLTSYEHLISAIKKLKRVDDAAAVMVSSTYSGVLHADGTVTLISLDRSYTPDLSSWTDIVQFSASSDHVVGLKADGTVIAAGSNAYHQREVEDWTGIKAVSAGERYTVGLKNDGTVISTRPYTGEGAYVPWCDDLAMWTDVVEICAGERLTLGLRSDGTVLVAGTLTGMSGEPDEPVVISGWSGIRTVSGGHDYAVAIDGEGWARIKGRGDEWPVTVSGWRDIAAVSMHGPVCIGLTESGRVLADGKLRPRE